MNQDEEKFNEFFKEFYPILLNASFRYLKDEAKAKDCVQKTFIKLNKVNLNRFESKNSLLKFCFTCLRNEAFNYLRNNKKYLFISNFEASEEVNEGVSESNGFSELASKDDFKESKSLLKKLMKKLSEREKNAIKLRYFNELSYEKIAKKMKTSVTNVGFLISKSISKMRKVASYAH